MDRRYFFRCQIDNRNGVVLLKGYIRLVATDGNIFRLHVLGNEVAIDAVCPIVAGNPDTFIAQLFKLIVVAVERQCCNTR